MEIRNPGQGRKKGQGRNPKAETRKKSEIRNPKSEYSSVEKVGCFGFGLRLSAFFRPSGFGFRPLSALLYLTTATLLAAADTNGAADMPPLSSLKPPRAEILPTVWEQYGPWIRVAAVLLLAAVVFAVWLTTRPKPATPVPFAVHAREELERLRQEPENGAVLSKSSQILTRYITAAFSLPAEEATTSEFCRRLLECERIGPELANQISDFLRECDLRKFAPSPPASALGAATVSLKRIERAESRLEDLNRRATLPKELARSGVSGEASGT